MLPSWIDTHNHLFVFDSGRLSNEILKAKEVGVIQALVCAGAVEHFEHVIELAHKHQVGYALGLHPLFITDRWEQDVITLEKFIADNINDPLLIAVGECGIDGLEETPLDVQEKVFRSQLKLAKRYGLPLSIHGRSAMDNIYKSLRQIQCPGGVIHAFNGSVDQAKRFVELGYKLGCGGAITYDGSRRIRKILSELASNAFVMETDCPDMPASWARESNPDNPESSLADIVRYGLIASELRSVSIKDLSEQAIANTLEVFPKFEPLLRKKSFLIA